MYARSKAVPASTACCAFVVAAASAKLALTATTNAQHAALAGTAFDRAYVANEVAYHRQVNEVLRTTLIPGARNAELRALLETGLALFTEHEGHAEMLVKAAN